MASAAVIFNRLRNDGQETPIQATRDQTTLNLLHVEMIQDMCLLCPCSPFRVTEVVIDLVNLVLRCICRRGLDVISIQFGRKTAINAVNSRASSNKSHNKNLTQNATKIFIISHVAEQMLSRLQRRHCINAPIRLENEWESLQGWSKHFEVENAWRAQLARQKMSDSNESNE